MQEKPTHTFICLSFRTFSKSIVLVCKLAHRYSLVRTSFSRLVISSCRISILAFFSSSWFSWSIFDDFTCHSSWNSCNEYYLCKWPIFQLFCNKPYCTVPTAACSTPFERGLVPIAEDYCCDLRPFVWTVPASFATESPSPLFLQRRISVSVEIRSPPTSLWPTWLAIPERKTFNIYTNTLFLVVPKCSACAN